MKKFVEKHIKRLKNKYYTDYFRKYANDSRKQWKMINSLLNRKKTNSNIGKIILDDDNSSEMTSPGEISNAFNDYFCGIAKKLKDNSTHIVNPDTPKFRDKRIENSIFLSDCTKTEIEDIVNSLKNKSTSDTAVVALKYVSASISSTLSAIINASFLQGVFPEKLKLAKVIPIHKAGKKTNVSNYRPISLLSVFSKIYEKSMHKRLYDFFSRNETIYKHQYGFRKQHSCEHALLEAQYTLTKALDNKQISALLLIDFSKAFDMVDHNTLIYKLEHYGIRGQALNWLKSYLDKRRQYVSVNGHNSRTRNLSCGVPQGSILGPLLFVIFINDLPFIDNLAKFILYADDANIIFTGQSIEIIETNMRNFISELEEWVALNGLKLNISKTKYMLFSNRNTRDINVKISANSIERKQTERFLGVIIDDKLTFKQHRATLASKIARNAGVIYKVKGIVPLHVIKTLYNSFIQSHLVYCSNVWGLGSKNSVARIFSAQKRAIRGVKQGFVNYFYKKDTGELPAHTKKIFAENEFLTIHNLIAQQAVAFMQKVSAHIVPKPTCDNFELIPSNDEIAPFITDNCFKQPSLGPHPRRLLNFITESNEANLTIMHPRRATDFFKPPQFRFSAQSLMLHEVSVEDVGNFSRPQHQLHATHDINSAAYLHVGHAHT